MNQKSYVWDTGALIQFFAGNPQATSLMKEIISEKVDGYIPQLIFSEFYYITWKNFGKQAALIRTKTLRESKLMEYTLVEEDTYRVGELKLKHKRLSLADAIVATTALATSSTIVSTDMDFEEIPKITLRKIDFA